MKWTPEADDAIKKVPFFARKKVRARVEEEARKAGRPTITLVEVKATQKRFLTGMAADVKGFQLDACFGPSGCPNAIEPNQALMVKLEALLTKAQLKEFLVSLGITDLKFHHEFRVTMAECPNACSQPQIKDVGIIAACQPRLTDAECTLCEACVDACKENAITLGEGAGVPAIDMQGCVACGQCIPVCPTGTLVHGKKGYRVQLGGKLGRHPQLAREMPGIYDPDTVLQIVQACIDLIKSKSTKGERFGQLLKPQDFDQMVDRFGRRNLR